MKPGTSRLQDTGVAGTGRAGAVAGPPAAVLRRHAATAARKTHFHPHCVLAP